MHAYNETRYDREMIIRYNRYYLADFFKRNFIVLAGFSLIAAIYSFASGAWVTGIVILATIALYAALTVVIQKTTQNRALKQSPIAAHPIIRTYQFDETGIEIGGRFVHPSDSEQVEQGPRQRRLDYTKVQRISDRNQFMMIYDDERRTYLVDVNGFESPGQYGQLKDFLKGTMGKRFR